MSSGDAKSSGAGRTGWMAVCAAVVVLGVAGWLAYAMALDPPRAWRALLINFIYFTPLAAGMVVWPAVLAAARSEWTGPVERHAMAGLAFAPVSIIALLALVIGREHWAAWLHETHLHNAAWLNAPLLFARDAAAIVVLWALAAIFVVRRRRWRSKVFAGWLVFAYAIVLTLVAFDMVMALDPHWFSALFGGYFFVSGMYAAVAAWTLVALLRSPQADADRRHDLGKLIVTFSLLTTYMMFSQLIVFWYENLPEEVRFVVPRMTHWAPPWPAVSAGLLVVVYLGPLVFLLPVRAKRSPACLGIAAAAVLVGLWFERWWLVTPTLGGPLTVGVVELAITAACAAALALGIGWLWPHLPPPVSEEAEQA